MYSATGSGKAPYIYFLIEFLQRPYEPLTTIRTVLEMRKLTHRDIKQMACGHPASKWKTSAQAWECVLLSTHTHTHTQLNVSRHVETEVPTLKMK